MVSTIDTDRFSERLRARGIDRERRAILISRLAGSEQEKDISEPVNCQGFGRVRHFRWSRGDSSWPINPLPLVPAARALGMELGEMVRAQVFQNAVCNWRCWYCYVPFDLLSGNLDKSAMLTAEQLVAMYAAEQDPPLIIDLSGGQPDLVPEWIPWMMEELRRCNLDEGTYLWSDDNLSNDYFWQYLTPQEIELVASYQNYGHVCCFKGFNAESFAFNTLADPSLFDRQFALMSRFIELGIDIYGYVTFTTPSSRDIRESITSFVDRLQELSPSLPLRTVPLKIEIFSPVTSRLDDVKEAALQNQLTAVEAWQGELESRFTSAERAAAVGEVPLGAA